MMYSSFQTIVIQIIAFVLMGAIGALIGRKRRIGIAWAFFLGAFLSFIGWIIAAISKKKDAPAREMSKGGRIILLIFGFLFLSLGVYVSIMSFTMNQQFFSLLRSGLSLVFLGSYMLHCTRKVQDSIEVNPDKQMVSEFKQDCAENDEPISKEDDIRFMPPAMRDSFLEKQNNENKETVEDGAHKETNSDMDVMSVVVSETNDEIAPVEIEQMNDAVEKVESDNNIEMMYCKHCGKRIEADSTFCKYCGKQQ